MTSLELHGFGARAAYGAAEALKAAADYKSHSLLLDMAMPEMDGAHLAQAIRKLPELASAVLTGYATPAIQKLATELGCRHYFAKLVDWQVIFGILELAR
jgi:YesN/AraC family two-component response regulator